jgi:hypothetical protein
MGTGLWKQTQAVELQAIQRSFQFHYWALFIGDGFSHHS